ncbi:MAG: amidohydrolase family protein [Oscillospiraceae bacterium]
MLRPRHLPRLCVAQGRPPRPSAHGYDDGQIRFDASIHAEYTSRSELWKWTADYAKANGLGMHVAYFRDPEGACRVHRSATARPPCRRSTGTASGTCWALPPTASIPRREDWAILAAKGVSAIHNPCSNLKLGSGIAPVPAMKAAGVNVCLGTDGVSSNNNHDMFEEMKLAAILHNGAACDPLALGSWDALRMATVNGAAALGRKTGRIEPGYDADLILVDFSHLNLFPCHDPVSNLVYAAHGGDVCMNMARGQVIYKDGDFLTIDLEQVKREVANYAVPLLFGTK